MTISRFWGRSPEANRDFLVQDICLGKKQRYGEVTPMTPKKIKLNEVTNQEKKNLIKRGFSFKKYMEYALYDSTFGYYTSLSEISSEFITKPIKFSPYYGNMLSEVIFKLWKKLLENGAFDITDEFNIVEFGGGTGILARDILKYAKNKSMGNGFYRKFFYEKLKYRIIDISPSLVATQHKVLHQFKSKVTISKGDARKIQPLENLKGIIISNELPDAFPMHKIKIVNNQKLKAAIVYPCLTSLAIPISKELTNKIHRDKKDIQLTFKIPEHLHPLPKKTYKILRRNLGKDILDPLIKWEERWVSIKYLPKACNYCQDHASFLHKLPNNTILPLNIGIRKYQEQSSAIVSLGYKITIDYQFDFRDYLQKKPTFRTHPEGNSFSYQVPPGSKDITADVNASMLALEGERAGWSPIFFGKEYDLLSICPTKLANTFEQKKLNFNVLIEGKNIQSQITYTPMISLPLTYKDIAMRNVDILKNNECLKLTPYQIYVIANNIYAVHIKKNKSFWKSKEKDLKKVLETISSLDITTSKAIKLIFKNINILALAANYNSLLDFDFSKIAHIFGNESSNKETDILAFLIVEQLLQIYYYERNRVVKYGK